MVDLLENEVRYAEPKRQGALEICHACIAIEAITSALDGVLTEVNAL